MAELNIERFNPTKIRVEILPDFALVCANNYLLFYSGITQYRSK
jgi:hypothetical protein